MARKEKKKMPKKRKNYASIDAMPEGLKQYALKLENESSIINSNIDTFMSSFNESLIINGDEKAVSNALDTISKMLASSVVNNACAMHWCSFFQRLADGQEPEAYADIVSTVKQSLIQSFNWQIAHYRPISCFGNIEYKTLKSSSYAPSHVFSEKDYKTVTVSATDKAKRDARRFIDSRRGIRVDYKDKDGKNKTYVMPIDSIDGLEEWQVDSLSYRFTMENRTDENGRLIDYCDMSLNEYFADALHNLRNAGTISEKDYSMIMMILNGYSYEDVASVKDCSKQYVGKRMLKCYKALNEWIISDQDTVLGDRPSEVDAMIEKYGALIDRLED